MTEQLAKRRVNVRGIIYKDGKILAVCHKNEQGGPCDYYAVPGGGLDPYESLVDGMRRELMEETGVTAQVGKLLFIQQYKTIRKGFDEELEFFFAIENPEDFTDIKLEDTSHGNEEIYSIEYVDPKKVTLFPTFLSRVDIGAAITNDQPIYIADNFNE
jgi:8-oxo-dGTP pyrophosphatase MutT (NUDIX family)